MTSTRKLTFSTDTVTAIAAVFIAVVALGVSVWQVVESRRHDRLAVMPHLDFGTRMGSGFDYCGLVLDNAGLGPAVIQRFIVYVDGEKMDGPELRIWSQAVPALGLRELPLHTFGLSAGNLLKPGRSLTVFGLPSQECMSPEVEGQVWNALQRLRIVVEYQSLYEDPLIAEWPGNYLKESRG